MNHTAFWRLAWKEYRLQRGFWLAMLAGVVLADLAILGCMHWRLVESTDAFFWAALGIGTFYAVGCGGTLFAAEHEAETYPFQQALPVPAIRLFAAKIAYAVVSTAAMLVAVWLAAALISGWRLPAPQEHRALWGIWGVGAAEFLAWGVFFSLLSARPLVAVILAVACTSLGVELVRSGGAASWGMESYVAAIPMRAAVVGLLWVVNLWLGWRWFREPHGPSHPAAEDSWREENDAELSGAAWADIPANTEFGRLLWHHARQSAPLLLTFIALVCPLALARLLMRLDPTGFTQWLGQTFWPLSASCFAAVFLIPPLMGACVFLADQSRGMYRFLAERGVAPKYVWLSRQVVWFVPLAAGTLAVAAPVQAEELEWTGLVLGYVMLAYTCGQFFSMFFRSGVLAAGFGIASTVGLCQWALLMHQVHMSWWWSVAPIPFALIACTWLRTSDWLVERTGVRAYARACWPLALAVVPILAAVPAVRVLEIPKVNPGFGPDEYTRSVTAEAEAALATYRRAVELMRPPPGLAAGADPRISAGGPLTREEIAWLEANREVVSMVVEASRRSDCDFFTPLSPFDLPRQIVRLAGLVFLSGRQLEAEGNADAALERYLSVLRVAGHLRRRAASPENADAVELWIDEYLPYWASRPGQTPHRVLAAVRRADAVLSASPPRSDCIKAHYLLLRAYLEGDPQALAYFVPDERDRLIARATIRCLVWERARSLRALDLWTSEAMTRCVQAESSAAAGGRIAFAPSAPFDGSWWDRIAQTTPLFRGEADPANLIHGLLGLETHRRVMRSLMALEAWKLDHGRLPESLEELRGRYADRLPVDPFRGKLFRYYRSGVKSSLRDARGRTIEPGRPFLWGPTEQTLAMARFEAPAGGDSTDSTVSSEQALASGWAFAIP